MKRRNEFVKSLNTGLLKFVRSSDGEVQSRSNDEMTECLSLRLDDFKHESPTSFRA